MRELSTRAERWVTAAAEEIWSYRLDFHNLPEYNPAVTGLEQVDAGAPDGTGARYRFELRTAKGASPVELMVTESVRGKLVAARMDGAVSARERFTVSADADRADARCLAAIDLVLLLPDELPLAGDDALVAYGHGQIADELEAIRARFEAGLRSTARG